MTAATSRVWARLCIATVLMWPWAPGRPAIAQETAVAVEPADLVRRDDLVGKLVSVDDRIRFFQNHPRNGYDELYLKRTPIPFRLPPELRPKSPPRAPGVVVQGRLTKQGDQLAFDVTGLSLQASELERLDKAVGALPAKDFESRRAWARWAEKRADDFKDPSLKKRAQAVEAEALRIEAAAKRSTVDAPDEWLKLAEQARKRKVPEPDPSALAHKAFRAKLDEATSPEQLKALQAAVERFFPGTAQDHESGRVPLGRWAEEYHKYPAVYRTVPAEIRKPLDRRLWADVTARMLQRQAARDVRANLEVLNDAETLIPERPELIAELVDQAQTQARRDLPGLRYTEVQTIGRLLRDRVHDPDAALEFQRDWLKSQRDRLSTTDAEGRLALASRYDALLSDAETARQLLEEAWKIAPGSEEISQALKLRGYRRVGDDWVRDTPLAAPARDAAADSSPLPGLDHGLQGKTPDEVRNSLATEPTHRSFIGTKGRLIEQWIFVDTRQTRYVNFLYSPGDLKPRVISDYFLSR